MLGGNGRRFADAPGYRIYLGHRERLHERDDGRPGESAGFCSIAN
jgi:hypothetical protein